MPAYAMAGGSGFWTAFVDSANGNEQIRKVWKALSDRGSSESTKAGSTGDRRSSASNSKKRVSRLRRCTWCANMRLKPSPARGMEKLLFFVLFRPYMCDHCKQRFYRPIGG